MAADPKCSTCAYRVYERRAFWEPEFVAGATMVCLHPEVSRMDCRQARLAPSAPCGEQAVLWRPHAAPIPPQQLQLEAA